MQDDRGGRGRGFQPVEPQGTAFQRGSVGWQERDKGTEIEIERKRVVRTVRTVKRGRKGWGWRGKKICSCPHQ